MNDSSGARQELRQRLRLARGRQKAFQLRKRIFLIATWEREHTLAVRRQSAENVARTRALREMPCVLRLRLNTAAFAAIALVLTRSKKRTRFCSLRTCDAAGATAASAPPPVVVDSCLRLSFETRASMRARRLAMSRRSGRTSWWRAACTAAAHKACRQVLSERHAGFAAPLSNQPPATAMREDASRSRGPVKRSYSWSSYAWSAWQRCASTAPLFPRWVVRRTKRARLFRGARFFRNRVATRSRRAGRKRR